MLSWGADGVRLLNPGLSVTGLSAGRSALAIVTGDGDARVVSKNERDDGTRVGGNNKCREKIQAVCCGDDDDDDDGDDVFTLLSESGKVLYLDTTRPDVFRPLKGLRNIAVSQVACGNQHSVALTKDGQVYTWGQASRGSPQHLRSLSAVPLVQIAAGGGQSFALSVSGAVFGWGRNHRGQLGLGDTTDRLAPTLVHCLNMKKTIHISCGMDHTAIVTKNGAVFTFGSGQYGQLGHNSFRDELRPRLVTELWGAKVTEVACGRHHTLVLTDSRRVYSFGRGEQGQLGRRQEGHPSVPLPVQLPPDAPDDLNIRNIYAGRNCSFAMCTSVQDVHEEPNNDSIDDMIDRWLSKCDSKPWKKIKGEIRRMFSSASRMNRMFLDRSKDRHFQTSSKYSGLDLSLAQTAFEKLAKKENVLAEVEAAVLHLLPSLGKKPAGVEGLRIYLLLNELLHVIQSPKLAEAVAAAVQRLPAESLQVVVDWWSLLPSSTRVKHVKVWRQALSTILSLDLDPRSSGVRNLLLVLQHMYNANDRIPRRRKISEKTFCVEMSETFLLEDLEIWRSVSKIQDTDTQPLVLCNFPFVMDLKSKKMVFDINATCTKMEHQGYLNWPFGWVRNTDDFFQLKLKRLSLLEGTFTQLAAAHHSTFKKPLVVYFDDDPQHTQVYRKDLFHHFFHELVSTKSGMFMFNDSKTLAWFPSKVSDKDKTSFFLFGFLCGLALYNQSIIHLPFPLALFKKLLGVQPTLEDMTEFSPDVGKSLQYVLDYEEDDLEDLDMCFSINWDGTEVDLDPHNPGKPVTGQNKKEFVEAYVNHAFNTSVEGVFQAFKQGFFQVCDQDLVGLFRPGELQRVLVGQDVYDWAKLKQNTEWDPRFSSYTMKIFWEVFDELTEDQRKDFLWFLTGFRRAPVLGMDHVQMKVDIMQRQTGRRYDQHYPESLTCHSILYLPQYSSKKIMRDRLTEALTTEMGFLM